WQSIRLLTGGLLVRVQPGEPRKGLREQAFLLSRATRPNGAWADAPPQRGGGRGDDPEPEREHVRLDAGSASVAANGGRRRVRVDRSRLRSRLRSLLARYLRTEP